MQTRLFSMPRLFSIFSVVVIAALALCSTAFAGSRAETATYVDGNVTGFSPNTGGTLMISDDKSMFFRTGLATVPVTYSSISHAELGAVRETSHDVPFYKVWELNKRFAGKTETQLLIVNFKDEQGEEKTMTLELARAAAPGILSAIQSRTAEGVVTGKTLIARSKSDSSSKTEPKKDPGNFAAGKADTPKDPWWGDDYWKTTRNADRWNSNTSTTKPAGSTNNDQR
jgi:hypothetical protein